MTAIRSSSVTTFALVLVLAAQCLAQEPEKRVDPVLDKSFRAVLVTATGKYPHEFSTSYGDFTFAGPKTESLKPLPNRVRHVAYDSAAKQLYGLLHHQICRIDEKGKTAEMKLPADVPELSWPCGIAFDTKRERLIVVSLGGVGHMYSYAAKTSKWTLVADMNNLDLAALTYDAKSDLLYGLFQPHGGKGLSIGAFNANGALVQTIELADPAFPALNIRSPAERPVQLIATDEQLAIVTENRIVAVDPKTEKFKVTWSRR